MPEGWDVNAGRSQFVREDSTDRFSVQAVTPAADGGFDLGVIRDNAVIWLPIIFMGALLVVLLLAVRTMPRTKPQEIKPESNSSVRWDDVAGVEEAKDELREVVEFMRDPKRFRKLGARVPKGILLHGPPGTGKTLLAKAVANESNATFYAQSAASFVEMFVGLGAARIRRLFRQARKAAPAIIFIDELDAVGATRGKDISGEKDQTLNQLLVELDGFGDRDDVVVIAASNMLEHLDPALLRPGRFDRQILVTPPDLKGRKAILDVHTVGKPLARRRGPGADRPPDQRAERRRAGQHLQRGRDLRRAANRRDSLMTKRLPGRARARDRRHAVTPRDHAPREEGGGLPRGRARAVLGAAPLGGAGAQDLDHPPRARRSATP